MTEPRYIHIPKWEKFQHYKDRDPKWIKLYNSLLHDDEYLDLSSHRRAFLHGLWLAYASSGCELRLDTRSLSRRLQLRVTTSDIRALIDGGWMTVEAAPNKGKNDWASRYVSDETRRLVLERDNHKCVECGETEPLEIDHIVPISKGGTGDIDNLQTLCRTHNRSKHDRESVPGLSSIGLPREETETEDQKTLAAPPPEPVDNPKSERPRDELWDVMADLFGPVAEKTNAHAKRNKAVGDLRKLGATPETVRYAFSRWHILFVGASPTDVALATHYPQLTAGLRAKTPACFECGVGGGLHLADCSFAVHEAVA